MRKIYIIQQEGTDLYKIGFTRKKVSERIQQLQTGSANKLLEVFELETKFAPTIEKAVQRFRTINRMNGEWFTFDYDELRKVQEDIKSTHRNLQFLEDNKI